MSVLLPIPDGQSNQWVNIDVVSNEETKLWVIPSSERRDFKK